MKHVYMIYIWINNIKMFYGKYYNKETALYEYEILRGNGAKVELIQQYKGEWLKIEV